jgi:2',3'-cyclic-nucleotide 2'-phosphodiesterase (5'-nucleotidase family)
LLSSHQLLYHSVNALFIVGISAQKAVVAIIDHATEDTEEQSSRPFVDLSQVMLRNYTGNSNPRDINTGTLIQIQMAKDRDRTAAIGKQQHPITP